MFCYCIQTILSVLFGKGKKKISESIQFSYHMKHFLTIYFWAFLAFIDRAAERRQKVSGGERDGVGLGNDH